MSNLDLTPAEIKVQHLETIAKVNTFEPKDVSAESALNYLKTEEGKVYFKHALSADAGRSSIEQLTIRVVGQIRSGAELPRMEIIN